MSNAHIIGHISKDRRTDIKPTVYVFRQARTASGQAGALINADLDHALDFIPLGFVDDGAHMIASLGRWTDFDAGRDLGRLKHSGIIAGCFDQHARGRVARLTRVAHAVAHAPFNSTVIGVSENNICTLAAKFQLNAFQRICRSLGNQTASAG